MLLTLEGLLTQVVEIVVGLIITTLSLIIPNQIRPNYITSFSSYLIVPNHINPFRIVIIRVPIASFVGTFVSMTVLVFML